MHPLPHAAFADYRPAQLVFLYLSLVFHGFDSSDPRGH